MYNRIRNWMINLSLKKKLLLINSAILLSIGIVSGISVNRSMRYNEALLYHNTANLLSFYSREVSNAFDTLNSSSSVVISDTMIQNQLFHLKYASTNQEKAIAYRALYNAILNYSYSIQNVDAICITSPSATIWSNSNEIFLTASDLTSINELAATEKGRPCFLVLDSGKLVLARQIRRIAGTNLETLGVLIIGIDVESLIQNSTYNNRLEDCFYSLKVDEKTVYESNKLLQGDMRIIKSIKQYHIVQSNQHYYFVLNNKLPGYDWSFDCWLNYDDIRNSIYTSYILFLLVMICCVILSFIASNLLSENISKHFYALIKKMQEFDGEADTIPEVPYDYSARKDELGIVHRNFDAMAREQQQLIKDNYQAEMLMKNAQLKALEQQINPHFLYNTLEAINWHAKSVNETQISRIVESLGSLLHAMLDSSSRMITLDKELALIHHYITIQQFRFGERLQFHLSVQEQLLGVHIPKLSIQPLVENAIKYALEEITDDCHIYIEIMKKEAIIYIFVKNSGSQFEENLLDALKANPEKSHGFGIGLINIDTRIRLTYGEAFGLQVYNENEMAIAQISIPFDEM